VAKLRTVDNELKRDFIKFDDLKITGIDYQAPPTTPAKPASLHIKNITARAPYARVIIESDRSVNVSRVLSGPNGAKEPTGKGPGVANAVPTVSPGPPDPGHPHAPPSLGKVKPPAADKSAATSAGNASAAATAGNNPAGKPQSADASAAATEGNASA